MSDLPVRFDELSLDKNILKALKELGYEEPSPIQARAIPLLLEGKDLLGMAQTGTGKTAAFALPLISRLDLKRNEPQLLVLAPTRELALQVSEAFQSYAKHIRGFHVLPIYGGQSYSLQLKQLRRGPQVIVGTPGRILDHLDRKTLKLDGISALVLDEADEMLRMGFIDDVENIMSRIPNEYQTALFSATMPEQIRRISKGYMNDPQEVKIAAKTNTVENIEQQYWKVAGVNKIDALSRILETETYDGVIIFTRTKTATVELADRLEARGYGASPLNGDMSQVLRERTINNLKKSKVDIVVATDVAARGLDVDRIDLVINFDIPYDTEAYIHRIGRTGRAGRKGKAILFVTHRENRLLKAIEKATKQSISQIGLPTNAELTEKRVEQFKDQLVEALGEQPMNFFEQLTDQLSAELNLSHQQLASALLYMAQKNRPLQLPKEKEIKPRSDKHKSSDEKKGKNKRHSDEVDAWDRYRIEVGREHGVEVKNIVGAIANEADISSRYIGHIKLHDDHSVVELPEGMPEELLEHLRGIQICGKPSDMKRVQGGSQDDNEGGNRSRSRKPRHKKTGNAKPGQKKTESNSEKTESRKPRKRPSKANRNADQGNRKKD